MFRNLFKSVVKTKSVVTINGKTYSGNNLRINGNKVYIDGNEVTPTDETKDIKIEVHGNVDSLDVTACNTITVTGTVNRVATMSGDVTCGDVTGSVETMSGDIKCRNIAGDANTLSGNIRKG